MKIVLVVCLFAVFFRFSNAAFSKYVCEHRTLSINCGSRKINVLCAAYGRSVPYRSRCDSSNSDTPDTTCIAQSSISKVNQMCDRKTSCSVRAKNDVFGDPCRGTYKYLEVSYECVW